MKKDVNSLEKAYSANRVGELVKNANPLTYSLLQKIFDFNGPYRQTLHAFGIGDLEIEDSYLVNFGGKIYSDIDIENKVLWNPCGHILSIQNGKETFNVKTDSIKKLTGYLSKLKKELRIISKYKDFEKAIDSYYRNFSQRLKRTYKDKKIDLDSFLDSYSYVVFISYIYEIIFEMLNRKSILKKTKEMEVYTRNYDYLIREDRQYVEFTYKPKETFTLCSSVKTINNHGNENFIPDFLPSFNYVQNPLQGFQVKLECIKNNLRIKTDTLLYFFNLNLINLASEVGINEIDYLSIDEIYNINEIEKEELLKRIENRKNYYKSFNDLELKNILINPEYDKFEF